jgi:hypothetical protein
MLSSRRLVLGGVLLVLLGLVVSSQALTLREKIFLRKSPATALVEVEAEANSGL